MDTRPICDELREKIRHLEALIENLGTPMMLYDRAGTLQMINKATAQYLGGGPQDFIGRPITDLFPGEGERSIQRFMEVLNSGRPASYEDLFRFPTGERWFHSNYIPIFDENHAAYAVQVVSFDITEQKKNEEALRETEQIFSMFLEHNPIYVFFKDEEIRALRLSRNFEEMVGLPLDQMLGKTMDDLFPSDLAKRMIADDKRVLNEGKQITVEEELNGRFYETIKFPVLIDGRPKFLAGYTTDITEQKRAKERLESNIAFMHTLLDTIPSPIFYIDREGRFLGANRAYSDLIIGARQEEIVGRNIYELPVVVIKEVLDEMQKQDVELMKTGGTLVYEAEVPCSDEKNRDYIFYKSTFSDAEGKIAGMVVVMLDITDRKRGETERAILQQRLQQAQKMESIGTLAGGIAHDFNNILFPILAYSELTAMGLPSDSPLQHNIKQIYKSAERARDLVQQILAFARQQEKERIPLKISQILKETVILLRSSIPSTIAIRYDIKQEVQDTVLADPTQINQIIVNLSSNAAHAMEEKGGTLELSLANEDLARPLAGRLSGLEPGGYLKLSVRDTGHGIDPQIMEKIFEPYFTTKERGKGTGMGLAIVHGIVKSYGGDITVDSELNRGTVFSIYLPLVETEPGGPALSGDADHYPTGTERILIVDDEKDAVDVLQMILETLGYRVTSRTSSIEALEAFRHNPDGFDLVITDQTMPNMTGKNLARELLSIRQSIPIILCTGYSEQVDEKKAGEVGIRAFVMKPIIMGQIADIIRGVLDRK